jgi:type IV pilus assembly protein PilC
MFYFFSRQLGLDELIELSRAMRFALSSGMMLRDVMALLAREGTSRVRVLAEELEKELRAGWSLEEALRKHEAALPPIFISLVTVGETSGNLPEVLQELEQYFRFQQKVQTEFNEQATPTVLQFLAAIGIVSLLIYVLGIIPAGPDNQRQDALGLGLVGWTGAVTFIALVAGAVLALLLVYIGAKQLFGRFAFVERFLLAVPVLGGWLLATAIARLSLAARLMLDTSLSVVKTVRLALSATNNPAFTAAIPAVESSVKKGNTISESLRLSNLFPASFLSAVSVGEESGRLPEALRYQGEEYEEQARLRLNWLTRALNWLIWLGIAAFVIFCIYQIYTNVYMKNLEKMLSGPGGGAVRKL